MCVSGLKKTRYGRSALSFYQNILYGKNICHYISPHFSAYLTIIYSQFTIKCLGSGNLKHTYFWPLNQSVIQNIFFFWKRYRIFAVFVLQFYRAVLQKYYKNAIFFRKMFVKSSWSSESGIRFIPRQECC